MAKDRFNTRGSYDPNFKFNAYVPTVKSERTITSDQVELLKKMYTSDKINVWEKNFIKSVIKFNTLSQGQKDKLNTIYKKIKN